MEKKGVQNKWTLTKTIFKPERINKRRQSYMTILVKLKP